MMDEATLDAHRDLCVTEGKPFCGKLDKLTKQEQDTLACLLEHDPALRLEQERIAWDYVQKQLHQALDK